jgi:hypothetical protein
MRTCSPSRCPETALVYQSISRSLHSNGSASYSTFLYQFHLPRIIATPNSYFPSMHSNVPSKQRACVVAQRPSHSLAKFQSHALLRAYKFDELRTFFENHCPLPRVAQPKPIAAQKTPWFAHLHPRLRGNMDAWVFQGVSSLRIYT